MKCPSCGGLTELDEKSCSCGWRARKSAPERKTVDRQCIWKTNGYQCQNDGHLSDTTHGAGPWYCRSHYAQLKGWDAWQAAVTDESQAAVDERVNEIVPREPGESEHDWSMRCKAWALARIAKIGARRRSGLDHWRKVLAISAPDSIGHRYAVEALALLDRKAGKVREPGSDDEELAA
jgi:hypothetical protein